ncbi:hypothetical protein [Mucilaginibacter flavidus]|uniref:hypothetical protein n=1 Tax=Mucilaginibacter flavidus TaxID=2949309 RepID=UPI00209310C0|nr:hypothetical protein [Mucilaginibacter flavidus]MCO5945851.1 hypothetical protein [Mucilaginibacter flavidus]
MKKYLFIVLLFIACQASAQSIEKLVEGARPMVDSIKNLVIEANNGFKSRLGQKTAQANGTVQYAVNPIKCFDAASQYISQKDGKTFYVITISGKKPYAYFEEAIYLLTNSYKNVYGPYNMLDDYINDKTPKDMYRDDDALFNGNNDGWRTQTIYQKNSQSTLARYRATLKDHKAVLIIGPVVDFHIERDKAAAKQEAAWREDTRKAYKMTGYAEQDSIGISHYGDIWGDGGIGTALEKLYELQANNDYDHTVGDAYKTSTGETRYRAPAWLNADAAYYQKDTSGLGTMLNIYLQGGQPKTLALLQAIRRLYSAANYKVFGTPGPHEFLYFNREGSNMMYRYDTTATSAYKGLTIVIMQMWKLKEKRAEYNRAQSANDAMDRYNNQHANDKGQPVYLNACSCCHGSGKQQTKTDKTYSTVDKYGNKTGTTSYIDTPCPCCHGTGKQ